MIMTLRIKLVRGRYYNDDWSADIKLYESSTLEDLHYVIQKAIDFDNDHLYCFFLSRTDWSQRREYFDAENWLVFSKAIKDLFPLPAKQSLYYLFDWGDEWVFKISRCRISPHEPLKSVKYPKIESESGVKPVQYADE